MTFPSIFPKKHSKGAALPGEARAGYLLVLPSALGVSLFVLLPFAETLRRSFTDARGANFTGLANYESVLQNGAFRLAAYNTARFICICLPILLALSLILALALRTVRPAGRGCKTAFLMPMAIPVASIVFLWQILFDDNGLANRILTAFGAAPIEFMETGAAFWVLVGTYVWKNAGYDMILWLSGLDGINPQYYEAAAVDGATAWQSFRRITLPQLLPTLGLVAMLSLLNTFKVFREAYLVAGSYPHESIYLLQHLFNNWFASLDFGRLTASAVLVAAALLIVLGLLNLLGRDRT